MNVYYKIETFSHIDLSCLQDIINNWLEANQNNIYTINKIEINYDGYRYWGYIFYTEDSLNEASSEERDSIDISSFINNAFPRI